MPKIEKLIEKKKIKQEQRSYLGCSQLGIGCQRWLWYDFRFATKKGTITPRENRLFSRGHKEEPIIIKDLESIGIKVISTQEKVSFCFGHGSGHCDGILTNVPGFAKKEKILLECKTSNTRAFETLKSKIKQLNNHNESLKKSKYQHFVQCQLYMALYKLKYCLYIIVCKETDERQYLIIKKDKKFCKSQFEKTERILRSDRPPERIGDRNYYMCRPYTCKIENKEKLFCPHRGVCHNDEPYQKTCRTCKFVEIHDNGRWFCNNKKQFVKFKKQLKGCKKYGYEHADIIG